ncbi:MAG: hypothetical protein LBH59_07750 [Planctomycetaceae bacterium]|nr:hypothetical protein [Planctomycetaceae bacterium]
MSKRTVWSNGRKFTLVNGRSYDYRNGNYYRNDNNDNGNNYGCGCLIWIVVAFVLLSGALG